MYKTVAPPRQGSAAGRRKTYEKCFAFGLPPVDISPAANSVLEEYSIRCARDHGMECALRLLDAFDDQVSYLESTPMIGCARLKYIPSKYRVITFWPHLWLVFQIKEDEKRVKIEYIIDDRQNYGSFLR